MLQSIAQTACAVGDYWLGQFRGASDDPFDQKARDMFAEFADQMRCMIYRCDVSPLGTTRVTYSNDAIRWIYEVSIDEIKEDPRIILNRVHPDDYDRIWSALMSSHKTGNPWHEQYRVILPEKGPCWREARATVRKLSDGGSVWHGFIWDISEQKEAEAMQSRFFAMMGHELRTPISGVIGYAELLNNAGLNPEQNELLAMISQSGEHLLELVNDLLDFSNINAGKLALKTDTLNLAQICEAACDLIRPKALESDLEIECIFHDLHTGAFDGDRLRITQILTNLLANALKHGARKKIRVTLTSEPVPNQKISKISISVDDDGCGIAEGARGQIFEPFVQMGTGSRQSSGLGLPLARQLAQQMNGDIIVADSDLGGASFCLMMMLPHSE